MNILEEKVNDFIYYKFDKKSSHLLSYDIIGYGSGVKKQSNNEGKCIDLIMSVSDDLKWHRECFNLYPELYSSFGMKSLKFYKNLATDINYLLYVNYKNQDYKLGIINQDKLKNNLVNWNNFYLAGRMQKPIHKFKVTKNINEAININRKNALLLSLLLIKDDKAETDEILNKICSLSYTKDIRFLLGFENKNKIRNIVNGCKEELFEAYIKSFEHYFLKYGNILHFDKQLIKNEFLKTMPEDLYAYLVSKSDFTLLEDFITKHSLDYINKLCSKENIIQPIKGYILNSKTNTNRYLKEKKEKSRG